MNSTESDMIKILEKGMGSHHEKRGEVNQKLRGNGGIKKGFGRGCKQKQARDGEIARVT